ncbi:MAG TPA: polysaccharide deacetylase family protein [Gaiellaceae bacterium]|nr:polysaccharide deacetylase family protein [Gaiellaceae bacterium]
MNRCAAAFGLLAFTVFLAGAAPAAVKSSPLVGKEWSRLPTTRKVVALTFDCGGNSAGVGSILATLKKEHVAATFFVTGRWAEVYPAETRSLAAAFPVGNHTYDHADLTALSDNAARAQILDGQTTVARVAGVETRPLFRFPYGARDARTREIAASLGYGSLYWTVDTLGWKGRSAGDKGAIVRRVLDHLAPGEIVLMHVGAATDGSTLDADALPAVVSALRARGYGFATAVDSSSVYTQAVDDATRGRFAASTAWRRSTAHATQRYGSSLRHAARTTSADPARFTVHVPARGRYLVYARWPAASDHNPATAFVFGHHTVRVDQRRNGGVWTYLGIELLKAGERTISVSRSSTSKGYVIADAVKIVRR